MKAYNPPKLFLHGEINIELFNQFSQNLLEIEENAPKNFSGFLDIELTSEGGSAYDALAFYDRISNSRIKIRITGTGLIASAAVIILAAGHVRRLTSNAWVMVHEDSVIGMKGKMIHQAEKDLKHYRRLEDQWNYLLEKNTSTSRQEWSRLHKEETFLTALDCMKLGLIESIV